MMEIKIKTMDGVATTIVDTKEGFSRRLNRYKDNFGLNISLFKSSCLHGDDGPAVIYEDGTEEYWFGGVQYFSKYSWERRKKHLSVIQPSPDRRVWTLIKTGALIHRDDGGPAIEYQNGQRLEWLEEGHLHRRDGPAIIDYETDRYEYWIRGRLNRVGGPAIEIGKAYKEYWLDGENISEQEYYRRFGLERRVNEEGDITFYKILDEQITDIITNHMGPADIWKDGTKRWFRDGKLHRLDGPAVEASNGTKQWIVEGNYHREDGPAIEYANGDAEWFKNGLRHRIGGPSMIHKSGFKAWHKEGVLTKVYEDGTIKQFDSNGRFHAQGEPALLLDNGDYYYYRAGIPHREDGPAAFINGVKRWYLKGVEHTEESFNTALGIQKDDVIQLPPEEPTITDHIRQIEIELEQDKNLREEIEVALQQVAEYLNNTDKEKRLREERSNVLPSPVSVSEVEDAALYNLYCYYLDLMAKETVSINDITDRPWVDSEEKYAAILGLMDGTIKRRRGNTAFKSKLKKLVNSSVFSLITTNTYLAYLCARLSWGIEPSIDFIHKSKLSSALKMADQDLTNDIVRKKETFQNDIRHFEYSQKIEIGEAAELKTELSILPNIDEEKNHWGLPLLALAAAAVMGLGGTKKINKKTNDIVEKQVEKTVSVEV